MPTEKTDITAIAGSTPLEREASPSRSRLGTRARLGCGLGVLAAVVIAVLAGWAITRTSLAWQAGEMLALASLGADAQAANGLPFDGVEERLTFGDDPQQYALVFLPPQGTPQRNSLVFFLHGGGWEMGNPDLYRFVGRFFASHGYPTVLGGYRLAPQFTHPAQLNDATAGLREGLGFLESRDVPVERIVVGGHSAGAQLAALLAYDEHLLPELRPMIAGLFAMSGPLDFSLNRNGRIGDLLAAYLGGLPDPAVADPIRYANPDLPLSVLALHGDRDPIVDPLNSERFVARLNEGAVRRAETRLLQGYYHSDLMNLFLQPEAGTEVLLDWLASVDER